MRRRRLLASVGLLAVPAADCTDDADTGAGTDGTGADATTPTDAEADDAAAADDGTATPTAAVDDLDLREANVTGVDVDAGGDHRFSVTLIHDDGEDGYADWWQVETPDGRRVGRRDLAHPHGTREFTRSETVSPPDGADCVVVRGHDRTHGYGGRAAVVALDSGATRLVRQGESRSALDASDGP